jgi:hypothetical protein
VNLTGMTFNEFPTINVVDHIPEDWTIDVLEDDNGLRKHARERAHLQNQDTIKQTQADGSVGKKRAKRRRRNPQKDSTVIQQESNVPPYSHTPV